MSNPVTNVEVEDVLSSIRRLVSEDKRPLAGLRSTPSEQVDVPVPETETDHQPETDPVASRLVLTPALRVEVQEGTSEDAPLDLAAIAQKTWTSSENSEPAQDEPLVLFPEPAANFDEPDEENLAELIQNTVEYEGVHESAGLEDGDYSDEDYWSDDDQSMSAEAAQPLGDHAGDEGPHDDQDWDVEDSDIYSSFHEENPEPVPNAGDDLEEQQFFETEAEYDTAEVSDDSALNEASVVPLTEKIAALEAAVGEIAQDWEPDGDVDNELASHDVPAMAWEDNVELDAKGSPVLEAADAQSSDTDHEAQEATGAGQASSAGFGMDEQLMDEEALRDLVSEIVRAELQGALGERITRNVRKLVRREIHRALTTQDME